MAVGRAKAQRRIGSARRRRRQLVVALMLTSEERSAVGRSKEDQDPNSDLASVCVKRERTEYERRRRKDEDRGGGRARVSTTKKRQTGCTALTLVKEEHVLWREGGVENGSTYAPRAQVGARSHLDEGQSDSLAGGEEERGDWERARGSAASCVSYEGGLTRTEGVVGGKVGGKDRAEDHEAAEELGPEEDRQATLMREERQRVSKCRRRAEARTQK